VKNGHPNMWRPLSESKQVSWFGGALHLLELKLMTSLMVILMLRSILIY